MTPSGSETRLTVPGTKIQTLPATNKADRDVLINRSTDQFAGRTGLTGELFKEAEADGVEQMTVKIITSRHPGGRLRCGTSGGFCVRIIDFFFLRSAPPGGSPVCTDMKAATPKLGSTQNNLHANYCF